MQTDNTQLTNTTTNIAELPVEQRAALILNSTKTEADLSQLAGSLKAITLVNSTAGREQAHVLAMTARSARTTIEKAGKAARDDATKFSKAVIAEEDRLIQVIYPEEKRVLALRDAWDEAEKKRKEEAARIERERIEGHTKGIEQITQYVSLAAQSRTSAMVDSLVVKLQSINLEGFEEFTETAKQAYESSLESMQRIRLEKAEQEAEQERIRAEQARIKEEQEAQAKALAAQRAELERQQAELKAQQEEMARQAAEIAATSKPVDPPMPEPEATPVEAAAPKASIGLPESGVGITGYVSNLVATAMGAPMPTSTSSNNAPPSAKSIVNVIAKEYGVTVELATEWLAIRAPEFNEQEA